MICVCIKDCKYFGELCFKRGVQYEYEVEQSSFLWVIYNKNGNRNKQGLRFYDTKSNKNISNMTCGEFYDFFEAGEDQ